MVIADGLAEKGRSLPLDVLRGIAILLVLLRHAVIPPGAAGRLGPYIAWTQTFGWTGVDLFFVLSGFLIGGLLLREVREEGHLRIKRFLIRRAFKIWPGYFVFLAFVSAMDSYHHSEIKPLWSNLLQVQNYLGTPVLHTWSLAVEEHFYLLLPLVLAALLRMGKLRWTPWLMLVVCAGCLGLRLMKLGTPFTLFTHLTPTHLRIDSLCFGVLLAYWYQLRPELLGFVPKWRVPLLATGCILLSPMLVLDVEHPFVWTVGLTMTYLGYGMILLACVDAKQGVLGMALRGRVARVVAFVGFYSYSIYLWHVVPARWLIPISLSRHGLVRWLVLMPVFAILATLIGFLAAKAVEQPMLRLRDRWFPSRDPRRLPPSDETYSVAQSLNVSVSTAV